MDITVAFSHRESYLAYLWHSVRAAWVDGEDKQAERLHSMLVSLEHMTDAEYLALTICDCDQCLCTM